MSQRLRIWMLVVCTGLLAAVAAIFAVQAFAFTATYCGGCTIGNVPAVSAYQHFNDNHSSTAQAKKQQIYYYEGGSGLTACSLSSGSTQVMGLNYNCTDGISYQTTARCHLLNDGTVTATCWANYDY